MGIFFFYNNRKPRKFNYRPVLYNPEEEERKERMEQRIRRIKEEMATAEGKPIELPREEKKTDFGREFLSQTKYLKRRKERETDDDKPFFTNNRTVVFLLIVLMFLLYYIFLR